MNRRGLLALLLGVPALPFVKAAPVARSAADAAFKADRDYAFAGHMARAELFQPGDVNYQGAVIRGVPSHLYPQWKALGAQVPARG